jgi:phosphoglucosamine mutase
MGTLFGTDGIRGVANAYPLTPEVAVDVGRAVVSVFQSKSERTKIVIGKDTRISGAMLECALASGIASVGAEVRLVGTLPTPGVAYAASSTDADAGIAISASHNPFYDNGIKLFDGNGGKLSDETERKIEQLVLADRTETENDSLKETGGIARVEDASQSYKHFLTKCIADKSCLQELRVVIDCSNGATYAVAPELFEELGARVAALSIQPDGKNINADCGSEHPQNLVSEVLKRKADIGLAFDGDGDRLIAVDEKGQVITGDRILAICAKNLKQKGMLRNNLVVSTVMSNLGLRVALKKMGIRHAMAKVGDRYVLEEMRASGASIGGEDSGHMIFSDHHTTGDGILSALKLIEAMHTESKPLSELSNLMDVFPQMLINVEVSQKPDLQSIPAIAEAIEAIENKLGEQGRVLVRYSGTQPLCRVMVEAPTEAETKQYCKQLSEIITNNIIS